MACSESIEAEDELVEVALQVLGAQPVIDAARQALRFREHLMDPWQHDVVTLNQERLPELRQRTDVQRGDMYVASSDIQVLAL